MSEYITFENFEKKYFLLTKGGQAWKKMDKALVESILRVSSALNVEEYLSEEKRICLRYAANALARKAFTSHLLRKKLLEKRFEEGSIMYALEKLREYGYLCDASRIEAFFEKQIEKGSGPLLILQKLQTSLGLSREEASEALERFGSREKYIDAANRAMQKMRGKNAIKCVQALYRKGFSSDIIQSLDML